MSLPRSSSHCEHRVGLACLHPRFAGDTDDSRCEACDGYEGRARGLGDLVASVTKAIGIDSVVKAVAPECGCAKRRAALNAAVPFSDQRKE